MHRHERLLILLIAAVLLTGTVIRQIRLHRGPVLERNPQNREDVLHPPDPAPAETVTVHVAGAVHSSGVYVLPAGARVADAVTAAGGLDPDSDPDRINLAAFLSDGQQIVVPFRPSNVPGGQADPDVPVSEPGKIRINTATRSELESLPGIGPVLAERIVAYRLANGAFTRVEDLLKVNGIGERKLADIRDLIALY